MIMELWNSIEQLARLNNYLQVSYVIVGILAALLVASSFVVGHRKDSLEGLQRKSQKEVLKNIDVRTKDVKPLVQRRLPEKHKRRILDKISTIKNTKILIITNNSKESMIYSRQFEGIFLKAGWNVEHFLGNGGREYTGPVKE